MGYLKTPAHAWNAYLSKPVLPNIGNECPRHTNVNVFYSAIK